MHPLWGYSALSSVDTHSPTVGLWGTVRPFVSQPLGTVGSVWGTVRPFVSQPLGTVGSVWGIVRPFVSQPLGTVGSVPSPAPTHPLCGGRLTGWHHWGGARTVPALGFRV